MRRLKTFFINTIILIVGSLLFKSIGSFFMIYISNIIGSEVVGVFQLILSVYMFVITLASSGLNLASTRVVSEELANNNELGAKRAGRTCIFISLLTGLLASFLLFINTNYIIKYFLHDKVDSLVIYAMCFALPFISMTTSITGFFTAVRRIYKNVVSQFFEQASKILFTTYLLTLFMPKGLNFICLALILGDVISEFISFLVSYILYLFDKKIHTISKRNSSSFYAKKIFRISIPIAITSYIRSGLSTLKQIVIPSSLEKSGMSCSMALSNYGIISGMTMQVITFPIFFISSFASLLIPEFSRYITKKDYKRIKEVSFYAIFFTAIFSILLSLIFIVFANKINSIFFTNYDVSKYLKVISPLVLFIYVDVVIDSILKGLDAQVSVMIINVIDLITTVTFIYFFVPMLGINGYILSMYISELLNFSLSLYKLLKILKISHNK